MDSAYLLSHSLQTLPASLAILQRIPWGFLIYKTNQHFLSGGHNIERFKMHIGGVEYRLDIDDDTTFYLFCY